MKTILAIISVLFSLSALSQESFGLELKEVSIQNLPALQSFAWGRHGDKLLVIGGRKDGLHKRRPFEAFLASGNNTSMYVIDLNTKTVSSAALSVLNIGLNEQLQSTNMNFEQVDDKLYIVGGYAYSNSAADHITFDKLTIVDVPSAIAAIEGNTAVDPHFTQISDTLFKVTGGYLHHIGGEFYLVGGQNFVGRYNPMGPSHGPGFFQEYTNQIRRFTITENAGSYSLTHVKTHTHNPILHRRDYNLVPQIFPNGQLGLTAFTGVFQIAQDLPWLDVVDIVNDTFVLRNDFQQLLNQYHTAHMSLYDEVQKRNHTLFFGGMAQYTLDNSGNLVEDQNVPFVKTISQVTRNENDSLFEMSYSLQMPALLGSGAEFIPVNDTNLVDDNRIVRLNEVPNQKVLLGYIYGGIESSAPNVFFSNEPNTSWAAARLFEVWLDKTTTGQEYWSPVGAAKGIKMKVYPNPADTELTIEYQLVNAAQSLDLRLLNIEGKTILNQKGLSPEASNYSIDVSELPSGIYLLELRSGKERVVLKVSIAQH